MDYLLFKRKKLKQNIYKRLKNEICDFSKCNLIAHPPARLSCILTRVFVTDFLFLDYGADYKEYRHDGDIISPVFSCLQCEKRYKNKYYLAQHVKHECGKVPRHRCPYCAMRTHRKYNLNKHIRNIHKDMPLV